MLEIARIDDLHTAKHVALLLDRECEKLLERNGELARENARLRGLDEAQAQLLEVEKLQLRIAQLERMTFGHSSERRPEDVAIEAPPAPKPPRKGHGPREQPQLPLREVVHELPTPEKACPACGGDVVPMGEQFEESEEITLVRRSYEIVRHRRRKYRCGCNGAVVTAPAPPRLVPGGRYSTEFAVEVAADKYINHLPLDRQRKMMGREGLVIDTPTLWDQVSAVAEALKPTYEALRQRIVGGDFAHADETRWMLIESPHADRYQAWGMAGPDAVFYRILPSRSAEAARKVLGGFRGVLMVDGYSAYETLARAGPEISLAHCWAHARRKLIEIELLYPAECKEGLGLIRQLYEIERQVPFRANLSAEELAADLAHRAALRAEQSRPLTAAILAWAGQLRLTKGSALRKAVEYMLKRWAGLTRFLDDPRVPLDNNHLERAMRPVALGRKNHCGSHSQWGCDAAAILYSLVETAKLCEVEPRAYLLAAVRASLETPGRVLLPHELRG
jgi:transposase